MKMFKISMFAVLAICCADLINAQSTKKEEKFDPAKMVGTWEYTMGMKAGEEVPAERLATDVVVDKEKFTLPVGDGTQFVMAYKLDLEKSPVAVDMEIKEGPGAEGTAKGIIKMEDGHLVLCYDPTGEKRPEKFESTEDNGFFMFKMKVKEEDK